MLFEKLLSYAEEDIYPFHMPGHKRNLESFPNPYSLDITEIDGFDNLHAPNGIILDAQKECACVFGAKESFFLVNGSSCGIISAILSACKDGDKIIIARNCHRSAFGGVILSGAVPCYIMPEATKSFSFCGGISPESVLKAICENPDAKAVFITSPTAEGITSDIKKIASVAHGNNMLLIVDAAHGAHFNFSDYFPKDALLEGADIVIESVHKTLPSLTQTALLHIGSERPDINRIKSALAIMQSSSPSYVLMASIDRCISFVKNGKEEFESYVKELKKTREALLRLKNFKLLDSDALVSLNGADLDRGKIVIISPCLSGVRLSGILREKYKIEAEMASEGHIVFITSVLDTKEGLSRLVSAFDQIDKNMGEAVAKETGFVPYISLPAIEMTPRQAYFSDKKEVLLENAAGFVSSEFVIPYPPGIPLIVPGERITEDIIKSISSIKEEGIGIAGIEDRDIKKIKIVRGGLL
ncbi:MAG: aminotransferase class I/II-fold pyridoxal phosphate-dependent enzyme [Lachnospiraceae bacterium]|nr:aminotransferase class I/II-fold pyridoxal phosphate-dependent enzyme [Lachnospiraceae bacterium]